MFECTCSVHMCVDASMHVCGIMRHCNPKQPIIGPINVIMLPTCGAHGKHHLEGIEEEEHDQERDGRSDRQKHRLTGVDGLHTWWTTAESRMTWRICYTFVHVCMRTHIQPYTWNEIRLVRSSGTSSFRARTSKSSPCT